MTYTRTNIRDRIIDVAEDLGWSVSFGTQTRIEAKALRKLRQPSRAKILMD